MHFNGHAFEIAKLALIIGFVLSAVLMNRISRDRRQKRWHDTVRLALEKGQPIPSILYDPAVSGFGINRGFICRGGLVWMAVGVGVFLAHANQPWPWSSGGEWASVPFCVGLALLILGIFNPGKGNPPPPGPSSPGGGSS